MPEWENELDSEGEISEKQLQGERLEEVEIQIEQDERRTKRAHSEQPERKRLKRELQAEALTRLEDAARTLGDFQRVVSWWDKLDANRERRERYHEVLRNDDEVPLDYGAAQDGCCFPGSLNLILARQMRTGDFLDAIFNCPYELHELVADVDISAILQELKEEQKELMFLWAVRLYSSAKIAAVRGQSDRNIRKVRATMLKQIHKRLLTALQKKAREKLPLTIEEKAFLLENSETALDGSKDG